MRITDLYIKGVGPFSRRQELFCLNTDDGRVLLTGISGSGKSTALWAMAFLWRLLEASGQGQNEDKLPAGSLAMHLSGLPDGDVLVGFTSDPGFQEEISRRHESARPLFASPENPDALRGRLLGAAPNMILLDGDFHVARQREPLEDAWFLTDDDVKDVWPEALSRLHKAGNPNVPEAVKGINRLLVDKQLAFSSDGEVQVRLSGDQRHGPHQLSMGEKHLAVLCFSAACCLKTGGVLLLDEPAVHLHPSQVMGLLTTLEGYCRKAGAQLLLVSHNPAVWQRYTELGLCVDLEVGHGGE